MSRKKLRITLGAFGTRGDVQAGVVLAKALRHRGHSVSLFVSPCSLALALAQGVDAKATGLDYEDLSVHAGRATPRELIGVLQRGRGEIEVQFAAMEHAAHESDVVVGSSACFVGSMLSERLGEPYVFVCPVPQMFESDEHPSIGIPFQTMPRWLNRLSWVLNDFVFDWAFLGVLNEARRSRGLARVRHAMPSMIGLHPIVAADAALTPVPKQHDPPVVQVGALFLEDETPLSEATRAFLDAGPAPVFIGFGSMPDPEPDRTTRRLLESVRRAGVRAIISRGWAKLNAGSVPDDVLFVGAEPHNRLFPRCAAIIHHGGAGTTHAAARAGVPQVVMPYLLDQYYWAHRVRLVGVSPGRVRRHGDDPGPLATAIRQCVEDAEMQDRARALAPRIATDGAIRAAEVIERVAAQPPTC